ncbi:MAG: anhydro-N-acetylmuramic acid kinase [Bacteroidota bacterium]|nr:anhydro-N-acetylmuramic acid kinase [Bacteroidota bacterium]
MATMKILGVMSGTSLDGLDLALTEFSGDGSFINYKILKSHTVPYDEQMRNKLSKAGTLTGYELVKLHNEYGTFIGKQAKEFLGDQLHAEFIASHGHTVFHEPENGLSLQIGRGAYIAAAAGISAVTDFRTTDISLGGQGAPLVPLGDGLLFGKYTFNLNLGGFSNISFLNDGERVAFDICPVNIVTNHLVGELGLTFDKDGKKGRNGKIIPELLAQLNNLSYYTKKQQKSLGREFVEAEVFPLLNKFSESVSDKLRTYYEHVAVQISEATQPYAVGEIFMTGGGTFNKFLVLRIEALTKHKIIIPENELVEYKEAVIFALLGLLRISKTNNVLKSYTGAVRNSTGGVINYV